MEADVKEIKPQVSALARADDIADAVSKRLSEERTFRFTHWQRLGALTVGLAAVVDVAYRIFQGG